MAGTRFDIDSGVDRFLFITGYGHMLGVPTRKESSDPATGVPLDGVKGFAPGAMFLNYKSAGIGTSAYINQGTQLSANWKAIA